MLNGSKTRNFLPAAMLAMALAVALGCGSSPAANGVVATAKPLSEAEESLVKGLEALPKDKRAGYAMQHMEEINRFSASNRTFGERMNAAMGIAPK